MRKKTKIIIVLCVLVLAFGVYFSFAIRINTDRNQLFKNSYEQGDIPGVYSALFFQSPAIENRPYLGLENAPLTIIVAVDFQSELAKEFYGEKMDDIMNSYVNTGQAKLYHKYYIPREELEDRKGRFIYASASRCYNEFAFNRTIEFNRALFNTSEGAIGGLAEEFSIPRGAFTNCIKNSNFHSIYEDMLETEQFSIQSLSLYLGVNGRDYTTLIGDPSLELIKKRMRLKQIKVGI